MSTDEDQDGEDFFVEDRAGAADATEEQPGFSDDDQAGPGPSSERLQQQQQAAGKGVLVAVEVVAAMHYEHNIIRLAYGGLQMLYLCLVKVPVCDILLGRLLSRTDSKWCGACIVVQAGSAAEPQFGRIQQMQTSAWL